MPALKHASRSLPAIVAGVHVREYALLTALALFGPYIVHALPGWDDTPLGARLIPVFYAPLLGIFWRQYGFTLALALASPWFNHAAFGMPSFNLAVLLSFELAAYSLLLAGMVRLWERRAWMGVAGYLLTKPFSAVLLAVWPLLPTPPLQHLSNAVVVSWPGVVVLGVLGFVASRGPHQPAH